MATVKYRNKLCACMRFVFASRGIVRYTADEEWWEGNGRDPCRKVVGVEERARPKCRKIWRNAENDDA